MTIAKALRAPKPPVVGQWNIFEEFEEIPTTTPAQATQAVATPAVQSATPTKKARPKIEIMIPATRKSAPAPAPTPSAKLDAQDLDFPLPGQRFDDGTVVDLEANDPDDSVETKLAKRMFLRMIWDLTPKPVQVASQDLFGQTSASNQGEQDKLDALVWMYSLNPEPALVTFEWVCDVLGFDPHRVRRITGRSMRPEIKRLVNLLSTIVGDEHAQACEERLSDYLNVSSWRTT